MSHPVMIFPEHWSTQKRILMAAAGLKEQLVEYTASGNPLSFNTNIAKPLKSLLIPWTPSQSGSGDPSPSNVRPISGVSGLTVYHSGSDTSDPTTIPVTFPALGKNLFDKTATDASNGYVDGYSLKDDGTYNQNSAWAISEYIPISASETYCVSNPTAGVSTSCSFYDGNKNYISSYKYDGARPVVFTTPVGTKLIRISYRKEQIDEIQLEKGSSATAYEPYTNTVYGGSLDLTTGVLTVEWKYAQLQSDKLEVNPGTENFKYTDNFNDRKLTGSSYDFLCSAIKVAYIPGTNTPYARWSGSSEVGLRFIKNGSDLTLEGLQTLASNNQLAICYQLATPYTIQLPATVVTALVGDNVIWSDTNGSNTAVYLKRG